MERNTILTYTGQAGFIIESAEGYRIGIDLYLSDCCERYFGFKRLMPYLYNPLELNLDLLIATHAHYDHFDPDAVPLIMSDKKVSLVAAADVIVEAEKLNLDNNRITYLKEGEVFQDGIVSIKAMPCDHGADTPDAIGLLITVNEKKIYIAGDTCYREEYFTSKELENIDVMIMPINGAFGNLNEVEGAKAASLVNPKLAIPCHFWNFAEHGGNPNIFAEEMRNKYSNTKFILMRGGETIEL